MSLYSFSRGPIFIVPSQYFLTRLVTRHVTQITLGVPRGRIHLENLAFYARWRRLEQPLRCLPAAKARRCARPAACFRGAIGMPCGGLPAHIGGRPCPRFPAPHSDHGCRESSECTPVPVAGEHLPSLPISRAGELPLTTYNIDAIIITRNSQSSPLALTHTGARPPTPTFRSS